MKTKTLLIFLLLSFSCLAETLKDKTLIEYTGSMDRKPGKEEGFSQRVVLNDGPAYFHMTSTDITQDYRYAKIHVTMVGEDKKDAFYNNAQILYSQKEKYPDLDSALYVSTSLKEQHQYLFVSQFNIEKEFHAQISCPLENSCTYDVEFKRASYIEVPRNGHYQHYMYKLFPGQYEDKNKVTDYFKISRKSDSGKNKMLSVMVTGTNKANIDVSYARFPDELTRDESKYKKFENQIEPGRYMIFKEENESGETANYDYYFMVKGNANDSVRFDVRELERDAVSEITNITPNDDGVFGFASMGERTKDCFTIVNQAGSNKFLTVNVLFFKGRGSVRYNGTITNPSEAEDKLTLENQIKSEGVVELDECLQFCVLTNRESIYYLQVNDVDNRVKPHIFEYQFKGFIYSHILNPGTGAYFSYREPEIFDLEMSYNMKVNSGYAKMYFITCTNYPHCNFNSEQEIKKDDKLVPEWRRILGINLFHAHKNSSPSSPRIKPFNRFQKLMVVICEPDAGQCNFEVSFHSEKDRLHLKENSIFYQYLRSDKKQEDINSNDKFTAVTSSGGRLILTMYNGNVAVSSSKFGQIIADDIYANRRVMKFEDDTTEKEFEFELVPIESAYYSVLYEEEDLVKQMETGLVTVETISRTETRKVFNVHRMFGREYSLSSDFIALNCAIKVTRVKRQSDDKYPLEVTRDYYQDVIGARTAGLSEQTSILYTVDVTEFDKSNEDCMIQMSFQEIKEDLMGKFIELEKPLIIPENYAVKGVLVRQIPKYRFVFPQVPRGGSVVWDLKVYKNKTSAEVGFGLNNPTWNHTSTEHQQIIITKEDIEESQTCDSDSAYCQLYINIMAPDVDYILHKHGSIYFELMVRTQDNSPAMLRKNIVRYDFLIETQPHYFFLKVQKGEEITVVPNMGRGSATVVARIVNTTNDDINDDPSLKWYGKWYLPKLEGKYSSNVKVDYNGKIEVSRSDCKANQCYLLIGIFNTTKINKDGKSIFPLSMFYFRSSFRTVIPSDTYVIDSFLLEKTLPPYSNYAREFIFLCKSDATREFQIDFISDVFKIEITTEDSRGQTIIKYPNQRETVISISADDFITIEKPEDFPKHVFIIKVNCFNKDTYFTELYSLRIREVKKTNLIRAEDDHPSICMFNSEDMDYCYFALNIRDASDINYVSAHAFTEYSRHLTIEASVEPHSKVELEEGYLDFIDYNYKSEKEFSGKLEIQLESNEVSVSAAKETEQVENNYLVFRVKPDIDGNVVFMTNVYKYKEEYKPNPTTRQLYNLKLNETVQLKDIKGTFNFRIVSVYGKGTVENLDSNSEMYYLQGYHDIISINSIMSEGLIIHATSDFIFYVEYVETNTHSTYEYNEYGKSLKLIVDIDKEPMPLEFYSKVPDSYAQTPVAVSINIINSVNVTEKTEPDGNEFDIVTKLINSKIALGKKREISISSSITDTKFGIYDRRIQTGFYGYDQAQMDKYKEEGQDDTYIYLALKKNQREQQKHKVIYTQVNAIPLKKYELDGNATYAPHDTYIHGVVAKDSDLSFSLERSNKEDKYYQLEVSLLSNMLDYTIYYPSEDPNKNITDPLHIQAKRLLGRYRFVLRANEPVNVRFFLNSQYPGKYDPKLAHFTFRYQSGEKNTIPIYMADSTYFKPKVIDRTSRTYEIELHRVYKNENSTITFVDVDYILSIRSDEENKYMESIALDPTESGPIYKFSSPKTNHEETFVINFSVSPEVFELLEGVKTHRMFIHANVKDGLTKCVVPYNTKPHSKEEDQPGEFPPIDEEESKDEESEQKEHSEHKEQEKKPQPHDEESSSSKKPQEEEIDWEWEEEERRKRRKEEEEKKINAKKNKAFIIVGSVLMGVVAVLIIVLSIVCSCKRKRGPETILDMIEHENEMLKEQEEKKDDNEVKLEEEEEKKLEEHKDEENKEEEKKEEEKKEDNIVNENNAENLLFGEAEQLS